MPAGGQGDPAPRPRFRVSWRWVIFAIVLLMLNFWATSRSTKAASRLHVPYSPFFLQQVDQGHVAEITSKGTAVQGTFTAPQSYKGSKPNERFKTEIPAFADTNALSGLLERKRVVVNAVPLDRGPPWWENLLLGFGPTILLIGLLVLLMRRAGNVQNVLGSF